MSTSPELQSKTSKEFEAPTPLNQEERDVEVGLEKHETQAPGPEETAEELRQLNTREGIAPWRWYLTLFGLYLGALLYGLDTTIAADVQGAVYQDLGEIQNLPWVGLGFPMASVATILIIGRSYGLFDVKWIIITSTLLFEIGSAICGAAPNMTALIFGRCIAGVGGAGMYLGGLTYVSVFATNSEAAIYNALFGLAWGTGAILGPVVGGAFSDSSAKWRWAFYINLPLAALVSPIYFFLFPSHNPKRSHTVSQKLREIDWVGAVLNGATFVLFMIVVTFSGSTYAWGSGSDIALWVVFGLVFIAYIVQQAFSLFTTPENRIFPVHFLKSRTLVLLYIATAAAAAANAVALYYIPLFFQFTRGDNSLEAAVRLLPFMCLFIFGVMLSGGSLPKVGRYSIYYVVGGAIVIPGAALMFTIDHTTSVSKIYGYEVLIAFGSGLVFQNAYAIAAAKVPAHDRANAIGYVNVSQIGTIAIALAIAGCLFQNLGFKALKEAYAGYGFPDDYVRSALAGSISPIFSSGDQQVIDIAIVTVARTIQRVFGTSLAGGAVIFVAGLLMRHEKIALDVVAGG